ncbi:MAG: DUF3987 domain-containing protein [Candidatus Dormibacteria bacterium]
MRRYTATAPCSVCGGWEGMPRGRGVRCAGFLSDAGTWARCTREEKAGPLPLDESTTPPTYLHRLDGPCRCGGEHAASAASANGAHGAPEPAAPRRGYWWREVEHFDGIEHQVVRRYAYHDAEGKPVRRVVRFHPKTFRPEHPVAADLWLSGRGPGPDVLYRLPELRRAISEEQTIYVVEGEKDAETLAEHGLAATTNDGGADGWRPAFAEQLVGAARVVVIADHDPDGHGRRAAEKRAREVERLVPDVRLVEFDDARDVTEWLDWHGVDELEEMAGGAPARDPRASAPAPPSDCGRAVSVATAAPAVQREPTEPLPEFPSELLPRAMRALVETESERLRLPRGMLAVPALVAAAAAIGGTRTVRTDDREHPASLWGAIVVDSGGGKTPALDVALRPYRRAAKLRAADHQRALRAPEEWRSSRAKDRPEAPPVPPLLLLTDATTEALFPVLESAPRGVLVDPNELSAWATGFDIYRARGAGPDRARYCSAWDGALVTIVRKGHAPVIVPVPIVSLVGGIQPSALRQLNSAADGLAQRFLYTMHREFEEPYPSRQLPDPVVLASWQTPIDRLLTLEMPARSLAMTEAGLAAWHDGRDSRVDAQREHGSFALYRKLDAMAARLALVLTLVDDVFAQAVDCGAVEFAWALCLDYFAPHGRAALAGTEPIGAAELGIEWLRRRGGRTTRRDLVRAGVAGVQTNAQADALIARWQSRNLVEVSEERRPGGLALVVELRS